MCGHVPAVAVLTTIILVVVVIVTPVCLAMPIAIDPVAVLVSIRPMITGDIAT